MITMDSNVSKQTAKHCAAFYFGSFQDLIQKGSADYITAQATMTFVGYRGRFFGITNRHVVGDKYTAPSPEQCFLLALPHHTQVPGRLVFKASESDPDCPYDLAIFEIHEKTIVQGNKDFVKLERRSTTITEGEVALAVGFPGQKRRKRNDGFMEHPLYHVVSTCRLSSDRKIVLYDELRSDLSDVNFGGMSGGPIFKLCSSSEYQFVGIVCEAGLGNTQHAQGVEVICLLGFPVGTGLMDTILATAQPL